MATITETTDAASGLDTIYTLSVGDTFVGSVAGADEVDRVLFDLTAGQTFTVTVTGLFGGTSNGVIGFGNFDGGVTSWTVSYADGSAVGQIPVTVTDAGGFWSITFDTPVTGEYSLFIDDNGDTNASDYTMSLISGPGSGAPTTGDDNILGTAGSDDLNLLAGNDTFTDQGGDDTVTGARGDDLIDGGAGDDSLAGGTGRDTIMGGDGNDTVRGGGLDDLLFGGEGHDLVLGKSGDDDVSGGRGNDTMRGNANDDILRGNGGNDLLFGDPGEDTLSGGGGKDDLRGGLGNDLLRGGGGADTLNGGEGSDTLTGNGGADCFVVDDDAVDTITDFTSGDDQIDLRGFGSGATYALRDDGAGNTILSVNGTDVALLEGVAPASLTQADFKTRSGTNEATITFDGGTYNGVTFVENGFTADLQTFAFQTTAQNPFQDLDGDGDIDFGVTDTSAAVTNIDAFAWVEFTQDTGDAFDFVDFTVAGAGGGDLDGNLIVTGRRDASGYVATATFEAEDDGLWDVQVRPDLTSGFTSYDDLTQEQMLAYFTGLDSLYIRSADGDGRKAVDTGNGIGVDDLVFA